MPLPPPLHDRLRLPVIASPMFIVSGPELVIAQCTSGVVGSFPALGARPISELDDWLSRITQNLADWDRAHPATPSAPMAVNLIVNRSNDRLDQDLEMVIKHRVPIVITSLGARTDVNEAIHAYGGVVLHDVTTNAFARKAIEKGADGVIAVAAGAGGHAGALSPMALVQEIREWFDGPLALSGAIGSGRAILAAQAMGADYAYVGSIFIATEEANASADYKRAVVEGEAADVVYSDVFTGVSGNFLRRSIERFGLDPDVLPEADEANQGKRQFGSGDNMSVKAWRDIWGCGQGIGTVKAVTPCAEVIDRLRQEYRSGVEQLVSQGRRWGA